VGTLRVTLDGEPVAELPLVALADAAEAGFVKRGWDSVLMWWESD
jgi:serine-type D-Ala-D-Ala carboxypeptidase (penicillin-binding protein 5/6)